MSTTASLGHCSCAAWVVHGLEPRPQFHENTNREKEKKRTKFAAEEWEKERHFPRSSGGRSGGRRFSGSSKKKNHQNSHKDTQAPRIQRPRFHWKCRSSGSNKKRASILRMLLLHRSKLLSLMFVVSLIVLKKTQTSPVGIGKALKNTDSFGSRAFRPPHLQL